MGNNTFYSRRSFMVRLAMSLSALTLFAKKGFASVAKEPIPPLDLSFIPRDVRLKRRSEWTSFQPRPWLLREASRYNRITFHHSGAFNEDVETGDVVQSISGILVSHIKRGYGDIGYHFVIDFGGCVWEGRSLVYEGAHVLLENANNIGIMLIGNYETQTPTDAQMDSVKKITDVLSGKFNVSRKRIFGHRDLGKTLCPGKNLYEHVVKLKQQ